MVLLWAPQRVNGSSDPCSGVRAELLARPRASAEFVALNAGLFYAFMAFGAACLAAWYVLRRTPVLINRSGELVVLNYILTCIAFVVVCLKRANVDEFRLPFMRCHVILWLYISLVPIGSSVALLRQIALINRGRYAKLANQLPHYIPGPHSQQQSQSSPGGGGGTGGGSDAAMGSSFSVASSDVDEDEDDHPQTWTRWCTRWTSVKYVKRVAVRTVTAIKFGLGLSSGMQRSGGNTGGAVVVSEDPSDPRRGSFNVALENEKRLMGRLSLALDATKFRALFVLFLIFYFPVVIIVALTLPLSDPYKLSDCRGCDLYVETVIIIAVEFVFFRALKSVLFWKIKKEEIADPDGVIFELRLAQLGTGLCGLLAFILLGVDPNLYDYNQVVAWEWLICLGFLWAFCIHCPLQLVKAWKSWRHQRLTMLPPGPLPSPETAPHRQVVATRAASSSAPPSPSPMRSNSAVGASSVAAAGGGGGSGTGPAAGVRSSSVPAQTVLLSGNMDLLEALRDDQLMNRFETFCVQYLVVETVRFVREARGFYEYSDDRSHDWMRKKAMSIYNTYVKQGAPLQVNIGAATRMKIEKVIRSKSGVDFSKRLFEEAVRECLQTLRYNIWPKFVDEERAAAAAQALAVGSKRHTTMKKVINRVSGWNGSARESSSRAGTGVAADSTPPVVGEES